MRLTKLDGLRGLFSLMVVFYHYDVFVPPFVYDFFLFRESYIFVDFFFVLSGYVIAYNYHDMKGLGEIRTYMAKRFARLFPLLFYTSGVFLLYMIFTNEFLFSRYPHLCAKDVATPFAVYFNEFLDGVCFSNSNPIFGITNGINSPSWSISAEMISYLVFGIIAGGLLRKFKSYAFMAIVLVSFVVLGMKGKFFATADFGYIRGFVGFFLGYFVWLFSKKKVKIHPFVEFVVFGLLLVVTYVLDSLTEDHTAKLIFGLAVVPLYFSLSIWTLLNTDGMMSKFLDSRAIQFLGKISYSVYLNHAIVILILPKAFFKVLNLPNTTTSQLGVMVVVIACVLVYSNITYNWVEKRMGKALRSILIRK